MPASDVLRAARAVAGHPGAFLLGGGEPLLDKIRGVFEDDRQTFAAKVLQLLPVQAKAPTERRLAQFGKDFVEFAQCV